MKQIDKDDVNDDMNEWYHSFIAIAPSEMFCNTNTTLSLFFTSIFHFHWFFSQRSKFPFRFVLIDISPKKTFNRKQQHD